MGEEVGDDMAADVKVDEMYIARNSNYRVSWQRRSRMIKEMVVLLHLFFSVER